MAKGLRFFLFSWPVWASLAVMALFWVLVEQLAPGPDALRINDAVFLETGSHEHLEF